MELLKDIASVSGKSGLFKVLKPTRNGVILESIDSQKSKLIANTSERVSILKDISIYTKGEENSIPLETILKKVYELYGSSLNITPKSPDAELRAFMQKVLPNYDEERVYCSDIKKLISWYSILLANFPDMFTDGAAQQKEEQKNTEENIATITEKENNVVAEEVSSAQDTSETVKNTSKKSSSKPKEPTGKEDKKTSAEEKPKAKSASSKSKK
ncbi:MAG: DUF5606 domain-containing protein [Cytophagaceae bacterium]|nr:DUF5606 domain-containing protein [Cytophagaceae bacterium]MDW8455509.1 DUF5606 domain-containing protein [Cytophagaceae bacterium]